MRKLTYAIHHQRWNNFLFVFQVSKLLYNVKKKNKQTKTQPNSSSHNTLLPYQAKILKDLISAVAWGSTDLLPTEVNEFNKTSKGSFLGYLLPLQAKNEKVKKIQAV